MGLANNHDKSLQINYVHSTYSENSESTLKNILMHSFQKTGEFIKINVFVYLYITQHFCLHVFTFLRNMNERKKPFKKKHHERGLKLHVVSEPHVVKC